MSVVVVGISHHSSSVAFRERFSFAESEIDEALRQLTDSGLVQESVLLSTCNRVELYVTTDLPATEALHPHMLPQIAALVRRPSPRSQLQFMCM